MKRIIPLLIGALFVSSCAGFGDALLVAFSIPDKDRAIALTGAGIDVYKTGVLAENDLDALAQARKLFEAALRYDPANQDANRYMTMVEDYRESKFEASLTKAQDLAKKPSRTPEEDYLMHSSLRRAIALNPKDDDAKKLLNDTSKARAELVKAYLEKSSSTKKTITKDSSESAKEKAYIDAFTLVSRATVLEPSNGDANAAYNELKSSIAEIVKRRLDTIKKMVTENTYSEARSQLGVLKELDTKIGRQFRVDLKEAEYSLYFSWASFHEKRKEWGPAESRATQAQAVNKTAEASELIKRVVTARSEEERGAGFVIGLKNLDALIAKGDLDGAQRVITSLSKAAGDSGQRKAVDERRRALRASLESVYARGVKAYKEEKFKEAIVSFKTVVNIDPSYEDASDYLEKAQGKQKLLDQY